METNVNQIDKDIKKVNFHEFLESNISAGIVLIISTIIAILWSNSNFKDSYSSFWNTDFSIALGSAQISMHLSHWVNDGLMAIFFFVVGLEIKREIMAGELSTIKQAALPAVGALGGMIFPILLFSTLNYNQVGANGWGIPMATDIAFSIGILNLFGKRVPLSLKVFLVALAIVDDLGAIAVIGIFYSSNLQLHFLIQAAALFSLLLLFNWLNIRKIWIFLLVGSLIWFYFLQSGIHATIAGVLVAMVIPMRRTKSLDRFNERIRNFKVSKTGETTHTLSDKAMHQIDFLKMQINDVQSPAQRIEHSLHKAINFCIMPIFALANAGVYISTQGIETTSNLGTNIAIALVLGKGIGITLFVWTALKLRIVKLPNNLSMKHIAGVALLGGVGFTMSLFISNLAFAEKDLLDTAKLGVLAGSFVASLLGYSVLWITLPKENILENNIIVNS